VDRELTTDDAPPAGRRDVAIDFRKWPDRRHWQFTMHRLGEDEHGLWLWAPPGMTYQRGDEPPKRSQSVFIKVITIDEWWSAVWNDGALAHEIYVDVATPPKWNGDRVTMIDLDLDVIRHRDGRVTVEDEDEFLAHQVEYEYPPHLIDRARTATAQIAVAVARRDPPFDDTGEAWLEKAKQRAAGGGGV
jgi:hypothetical protein